MKRKQSVKVVGSDYLVLRSPDRLPNALGELCDYQIDHGEPAIWIAPGLPGYRLKRAIQVARDRASQERLGAILVTG